MDDRQQYCIDEVGFEKIKDFFKNVTTDIEKSKNDSDNCQEAKQCC